MFTVVLRAGHAFLSSPPCIIMKHSFIYSLVAFVGSNLQVLRSDWISYCSVTEAEAVIALIREGYLTVLKCVKRLQLVGILYSV